MYRVILVDDEMWSLEGLYNLFDWESKGFKVIAQITDASKALKAICSLKPDVVFTDIRMPEISGIEIIKIARRRDITSEFIIVSGYAEFEYAQEALKEGAFDYQLKPVDFDEAEELIRRLRRHLDQKRVHDDVEIFEDLACTLNDPYAILESRNFSPQGQYWQVAMFFGSETSLNSSELVFVDKINYLSLWIGSQKSMVIFNDGQLLGKHVMSYINQWESIEGLNVGLSTVSDDLTDLSKLIREADMAIYNFFIQKESDIISFDSSLNAEAESIPRKLEQLIEDRNISEAVDLINSITEIIHKHRLGMYHVTSLWNRIAVIVRNGLECEWADSRLEYLNYMDIVNTFGSLTYMCEHIKSVLIDVSNASSIGVTKQNNVNENFMALLQHVNENYSNRINLNELAKSFFLNMSYCSELFKKVTGYTFSDYVIKLRMTRAAELLKSGEYSASYVSDMVGYNDYYYFCKMFKKFYGVSISQYTMRKC